MEIRHPQLYKITKNQRSKLSKSTEISKALLKKDMCPMTKDQRRLYFELTNADDKIKKT